MQPCQKLRAQQAAPLQRAVKSGGFWRVKTLKKTRLQNATVSKIESAASGAPTKSSENNC